MPPTNRKALYPEVSQPYALFVELKPATIEPLEVNHDDLQLNPRPTFLKVGVLAQVKGSAYIEYGNTKVIAAILPPRELNKQIKKNVLGVLSCTLKYAPFAVRDRTIALTKKEQFLSLALKKALEPMICLHEFPNFQIDVMVYVLQDDGCALSSAINCCGAALAEGGIPIYDIIAASTVGIIKNHVFVNPTAEEENFVHRQIEQENSVVDHGTYVMASMPTVNQIAECFQKGYMSIETLERLSTYTLGINKGIADTVRHILVNKIKQHLK